MTEKPRPPEKELNQLPFYGCMGNVVYLTQFFQRYGTGDIDYINNSGWNALIWAAAEGRKEAVIYLLECGANVDLVGQDGVTAEKAALRYDRHVIVALLRKKSEENREAQKQKAVAEKREGQLAAERIKALKAMKAPSPFGRK